MNELGRSRRRGAGEIALFGQQDRVAATRGIAPSWRMPTMSFSLRTPPSSNVPHRCGSVISPTSIPLLPPRPRRVAAANLCRRSPGYPVALPGESAGPRKARPRLVCQSCSAVSGLESSESRNSQCTYLCGHNDEIGHMMGRTALSIMVCKRNDGDALAPSNRLRTHFSVVA